MLNAIKTQEIMSMRSAKEKYKTQYFVMIITQEVDNIYGDLGYVIYTADDERELPNMPRDEYSGKKVAFLKGIAADPCPHVGNVVYHD